MKSTDEKFRLLAQWTARVILLLAAVQTAGVIYWFFEGNQRWHLGPITVSIHEWDEALMKASILFVLGFMLRPRSWLPTARLVRLFDPAPDRDKPCPVRAWALFGAIPGLGFGTFFSIYYSYLFPGPAHKLGLIALAGAVGVGAHLLWALFFARLPLLIYRDSHEEYRAGLRGGLYSVIWLNLFFHYYLSWEGRYFESFRPLVAGLIAGLGLALLIRFSGSRRRKLARVMAVVYACAILVGGGYYHYQVTNGPPPRDRVIFITLDTTRRDRLSCYGYGRQTSPQIDRIAASGVRFDRAICPMGVTDPSHASMFTGTYPRTHGSIDVTFPITGAVSSLPEYFSDRDYRTAAIVSRGRLQPSTDLNLPGFEYENSPLGKGHQVSGPHTFRRSANWLTENRAESVFIWAHFFDAHRVYNYHPDFPIRFTDGPHECTIPNWPPAKLSVTAEQLKNCSDLYDGEIAYMDYWVGKLVDWVNQLEPKSERPPLIVLVSDHGESLGEDLVRPIRYGIGHGGNLHHHLTDIPLIINWPGRIPEGAVVPDLTEVIDLAPTLVEYIFGTRDFVSQGQNLIPLIEGRGHGDNFGMFQRTPYKEEWDRPFLHAPTYALYRDHLKLITVRGKSEELYDVISDPQERRDLSLSSPGELQQILSDFNGWMERTVEAIPNKPNLSPEERDVLRDLGYIQ